MPTLKELAEKAKTKKKDFTVESWYSNYQRWLRKKERIRARNERRVAEGKKPIPFDEHPPKYPTAGNVGVTFYKGDFKNLSLKNNTVQLKVWDGHDWRFITVEVEPTSHSKKLHLDDAWEMTVPSIYEKEDLLSGYCFRKEIQRHQVCRLLPVQKPEGTGCGLEPGPQEPGGVRPGGQERYGSQSQAH